MNTHPANTHLFPIFDKLISLPSVSSDIASLTTCATYIMSLFDAYPQARIKYIVHNEKPSIIVQNYDGMHADIVLNGHFDVVPPSTDDQFSLIEKDGKLYARGAGDMKGGVAILITLMQQLLHENYTDKKVMLMLTSDEEVGGFDGVGYLVQQGHTGDIILCPDGGASINHIVHAEKGIYMFDMTVEGVACHSSRPRLGKNAITTLLACYQEIKQHIEEYDTAYFTENHRGTTVNLNCINGGNARNVLPGICTASLDIRYTETFTSSGLQERIHNIATQHGCRITNEFTGELLFTPTDHPILQRYKTIAEKYIPSPIQREAEAGGSDGRFFAAVGGVVILHKPSSGNLHGKDERVQKEDIQKIRDIFYAFIKS